MPRRPRTPSCARPRVHPTRVLAVAALACCTAAFATPAGAEVLPSVPLELPSLVSGPSQPTTLPAVDEGGSGPLASSTGSPVAGADGAAATSALPSAPRACEPPAEAPPSEPVCAQGETFGGQPADLLLTYPNEVATQVATGCVALGASGSEEGFGGAERGPTPHTLRLQLVPDAPMPVAVRCPSPTSGAPVTLGVIEAKPTEGGVLTDPIDPNFLYRVPFGKTSFWLQPWRAYLDTRPGSELLNGAGVNFNVNPANAEGAAQLLQESGFSLGRVEIGWDAISYQEPDKLRSGHEQSLGQRLQALHDHGLRPLITLNANATAPGPFKLVTLTTTEPASAGASTVKLSPASAAQVVPGKTGFNELTWVGSPDVMITSITSAGVATLSNRLWEPLPAGNHGGTTLLYAPFAVPTLPDGLPNPAYQATLAGWLKYVAAVCREAASVVGPGGYDLEIWNELSFGSEFLNIENYGRPTGRRGPAAVRKAQHTRDVIRALTLATVAYVRDPANGIPASVGITNGFASQEPFSSGAYAPLGLTALSKHPYTGLREFPQDYRDGANRPVNALGAWDLPPQSQPPFVPLYIPTYDTLYPEYTLSADSTETLVRDIAPFTTEIYGDPHGREVGPPGGPPVQKWITEFNLSVPKGQWTLPSADKEHFHAKALLRSLVATINKGFSREYLFGAGPGPFGLIDQAFYTALEEHPGTYPGAALGGEIMTSFRNMLARFRGPGPEGPARQLRLLSITQQANHVQFKGDGTPAHPDLFDRDVLAVLPFETAPNEFEIPVYVMTSDLLTEYEPGAPATDVHRFDLPDEAFRITLGNLPATSSAPTVSAYDPLRNESTPARLVSRSGTTASFEIAATDYPRLLQISYTGA
jgi:hypothetical protein